ncbi:MAG: DNA alkylation repair protein, partial [Bacteroidota bacterium]
MIKDIRQTLEALADPQRIAFAQRTFPTALTMIGVTNPNLRLVLREVKQEVKGKDGRAAVDLARTL